MLFADEDDPRLAFSPTAATDGALPCL